ATDGCADEGRFQSPAFVGGSRVSDPLTENFTQKLTPIHCQLFVGSFKLSKKTRTIPRATSIEAENGNN
ncbi:MAG: hypothetical protein NTW52_12875, partial [Planctomycetota bacterium]|nr:hypothetical protein [Planctomycetota bacterium]